MRRPAPTTPVYPLSLPQYALPDDLTNGQPLVLQLYEAEAEAMAKAEEALRADLRFEHLGDPEKALVRFIGQCHLDKAEHVEEFICAHARDPEELPCYLAVDHLKVSEERQILGLALIPITDPRVPTHPYFSWEPPTGAVAVVPTKGTNHELMVQRARATAEHSLRLMKAALRAHFGIHDHQLRFRLGERYALGMNRIGGESQPDRAYLLELDDSLVSLAEGQPLSSLREMPRNDVERQALRALKWMERARHSGDPLVALLFLFFAHEAILGDKGEGLKAHGLAFRQTMLGHIVDGHFTHPTRTWWLYDEVRSEAVHGGDVEATWDMVSHFESDVRETLNRYLLVAAREGLSRRGRLLKYLNDHPDKVQLIAWLRNYGGDVWTPFLDKLGKSAR